MSTKAEHPFYNIRQKLPALCFDSLCDKDSRQEPILASYLEYYSLGIPASLCKMQAAGVFPASGYEMAVQYWIPATEPARGTVFFLHGYYDHAGLFSKLIRFLLAEGLAVVVYDQPGHGLSSGEQASIKSFSVYSEILAECLRCAQKMPRPWYGVGQSTGCAVLLRALLQDRLPDPFEKLVLLAPLVRPANWNAWVWVYRLLSPFVRKLPRRTSNNSHDTDFLNFVHGRDPLQSRYLDMAWVGAMKSWLELFPDLAPMPLEVLVIQGTADQTVDWRYNLPLLQKKLPGMMLHTISGARHHLANEEQGLREQVFRQLRSFLLASGR